MYLDNIMITHKKRDGDLYKILRKQPYFVKIDNINLRVNKDVFPADIAFTSKYLSRAICDYEPVSALDMGCGTGLLALSLKRKGTPIVWACDHHEPAIRCTKQNAKRNGLTLDEVLLSNLFEKVPEIKFDLIVFNQAYAPPTQGIFFGCGEDSGKEIITRFFAQVRKYISKEGVIIMPFSNMALPENDPKLIAQECGFQVRTIWDKLESELHHYIYEIK